MSDDAWTWELSSKAEGDLSELNPTNQDRILEKLDAIVSSPWRDPADYGEPLKNSPYRKIRIGVSTFSGFKNDEKRMISARIKRRDGAYIADD